MPKTFTMHMTGGTVQVPATITGIRQALPEELRDRFTTEAENADADELHMLLMSWAMRIPTAHDQDEEDAVARLKAGDLTGVVFADELDDAYRSAG
ncbi:hypothetical protein [Streptomyces sp. UNOC14_S4]|uniref:hypothetical protein n=1 Tax=Streptomyces sp. UNOC14_S4 TaxID=2872340 RepID=UPI001E382C2B|nr:hypothetical protein [Streptomyces sp. UNOC14_S4]MCC3767813.1 hypothetical protein [Streptomyces sp. UNOC14_S4]